MEQNTYFGAAAWAASGAGYLVEGYFCSGVPAEVAEHGHDLAHVVLLLSAGYQSTAGRAPDVTLGPAIIFNPAHTVHTDRFTQGEATYLTLSFSPAFGDYFELPREAVYLENFEVSRRARRLHGRGLTAASSDVAFADAEAIELLDCVLGMGEAASSRDSSLASRAKSLLLDPEQPASTISALASALGTHPVHLARAFRRSEGCSPVAFRASVRATQAAELLRRTSRSITDIAHHLGFADHAHLSRDFQCVWGLTPSAYRRAG